MKNPTKKGKGNKMQKSAGIYSLAKNELNTSLKEHIKKLSFVSYLSINITLTE